jgi:ubiquinone/menaquinone biosynthesis C-methylase UbiE
MTSRPILERINSHLAIPRNSALVDEFKKYVRGDENILDIGCGDGDIGHRLSKIKNLKVTGVDNHMKTSLIPFKKANAKKLPFKNKEFDVSILVDVLHHERDIKKVLLESSRVSKRIIIKDHFYETKFQKARLTLIDYICNAPFGIPTIFNFLTIEEWKDLFKSLDLKVIKMNKKFKINRLDVLKHVFFVLESR